MKNHIRFTSLTLTISVLAIFLVQTLKASEMQFISDNKVVACNTPTITTNGPTQFCIGGSVVLSVPADTSIMYLWSNGASGNSITAILSGAYTVVAISSTCTSAISNVINVTVLPKPTTPIISSVGGNTICNGNGAILNVTNLQQSASTIAGSGNNGYQDGQGTAAEFKLLYANTVDVNGNVYVADIYNHRIRKVTPTGLVTTIAGDGVQRTVDGLGTSASFNSPGGLVFDATGNLYVSEYYGNKIRKIDPTGQVTTVAGTGSVGFTNGFGSVATFNNPAYMAVYNGTTLLVTEVGNSVIRSIDLNSNIVSTFAGSGVGGYLDGPARSSQFNGPTGIAISPTNDVYVTERYAHTIRKISNGVVSTFAGTSGSPGFTDGNSRTALFSNPWGIAINSYGEIFVTETGNHAIRKIDNYGNVTTLGGNGSGGFNDGALSTARFLFPYGLTFNQDGDLILSEGTGNRLRKIDLGGSVFWNNGATTQSISVTTPGNYTAKVFYKGCLSDSSNSVQVVALTSITPTIASTGPTSFCEGDSVTLTSSENNVVWSSGETTNTIVVKTAGTYTVTSTVGTCSRTSLPIAIIVNAKPVVVLAQVDDSLVVDYDPGAIYTWYLNGTLVPNANTSKLQINTIGQYTVRAINAAGCSDSNSLNVIVGINNFSTTKRLNIYPNPTSNSIILDGVISNNYEIFNHLGQIIANGFYNGNLSVASLPRGMYLLKIAGYKTECFVIE